VERRAYFRLLLARFASIARFTARRFFVFFERVVLGCPSAPNLFAIWREVYTMVKLANYVKENAADPTRVGGGDSLV
jgi:hypothetical protein